jgi:5-methyltetrahydrofolate--homocysteine methyltransferase
MLLEQISKTFADLNKATTLSLTVQAILKGESPQNIISRGLLPGFNEVAKRYEQKDHLYPDMYKASLILKEAIAKIKFQIEAMETKPGVRGAIGVVYGDTQDRGKNFVNMLLEAKGFKVKDLGTSVSTKAFLQAALDGADFIGMSIITAEGVVEARKVVQAIQDAGLRDKVKIIVGGVGVNAKQATEFIEADGYAEYAENAVEFLKLLFRSPKL